MTPKDWPREVTDSLARAVLPWSFLCIISFCFLLLYFIGSWLLAKRNETKYVPMCYHIVLAILIKLIFLASFCFLLSLYFLLHFALRGLNGNLVFTCGCLIDCVWLGVWSGWMCYNSWLTQKQFFDLVIHSSFLKLQASLIYQIVQYHTYCPNNDTIKCNQMWIILCKKGNNYSNSHITKTPHRTVFVLVIAWIIWHAFCLQINRSMFYFYIFSYQGDIRHTQQQQQQKLKHSLYMCSFFLPKNPLLCCGEQKVLVELRKSHATSFQNQLSLIFASATSMFLKHGLIV